MNNSIYLDTLTGGHLPLPDHKKFSRFKSSIEEPLLPNLAHCGITTKFSNPLSPVQTRDGTVLSNFKHEAFRYGRKCSQLETRLNNKPTFQSMNHVVYLNKIMAAKEEAKVEKAKK